MTLIGGAIQKEVLGTPCTLFYLYLTPNVVAQAAGLFLIIAGLRQGSPSRFVAALAGATTGIYGLHVLTLDRLGAIAGLTAAAGNPWIWTALTAVVAFAISAVVILVLRLVSPLRPAV